MGRKETLIEQADVEELKRIRDANTDLAEFLNKHQSFKDDETALVYLQAVCQKICEFKFFEHRFIQDLKARYGLPDGFIYCPKDGKVIAE